MRRPTRVLLVDDREVVRLTLKNILLDFDCAFSEAPDGVTALKLMAATIFDVIFLDLKLPDLSGIEILRESRKQDTVLGKVIIMTGLPELGTQQEASSLGAFKYLTKPLDWEEIRNAFAEAVSASTPPLPTYRPQPEISRAGGGVSGQRARAAAVTNARSGSHPRLLVLDDSRPWLDTMERVLGNDFDLTLTTSAEEACKWARRKHFALVVLDMRLVGGVSGLDVLSRMRRARSDLRAIILTGYPDHGSAAESVRRGAIDYVSKGDLASLNDTVKKILSENARPIRIFLSYEKSDRPSVSRLYRKLMARGFLPWMDCKSIGVGKKWMPEIENAIDQSDYFVFCLSHHSASKEGVMRKEIRYAWERQEGMLDGHVFFITARLDDCEVLKPFRDLQYVDLFRRDGFARLLQALTPEEKAGE